MSTEIQKIKRPALVFLAPFLFFVLVVIFAIMLMREGRDTTALPSALIGRQAPILSLQPVAGLVGLNETQLPGFTPDVFEKKITLMNVWASWCAPCRQEHPYLMQLAQDPRIQIIGLNYKDKAQNARRFLASLGNPYDAVGVDETGRAAIDWGVYGVPETFLVSPDGVIRHKFTGPLNDEIITDQLRPEIEKLLSEN